MPITKTEQGALTFIGLIIGLAVVCSLLPRERSTPSVPATAVHRETDAESLAKAPQSDGKYAAVEIVRNRAIAPSQVDVVSKSLVEAKDNFAFAYVVIDAPNPFGVKLRKGYCVILHFVPPRGASYAWNKTAGVVECNGPPDTDTAWAMKMANGWPDIASEPIPEGMKRAAGKRR